MISVEDKLTVLSELMELKDLLEQNDVSNYDVIKLLFQNGLIDIDDYFYGELETDDEDNIIDMFSYWDERLND